MGHRLVRGPHAGRVRGRAGRVTPAQMDRWCRDFDNWGIVDTVCFKLFDLSPHAWRKVAPWSRRRDEFEKRAASC